MFCLNEPSYFRNDIKPYEAEPKLIRFIFALIRNRSRVITTGLLQQGYYGLTALLKSVTIKPSVIKCKISP